MTDFQADQQIVASESFADFTSFSKTNDEKEILMMMLVSIFRLVHMHYEVYLCIFQLELCSENGHNRSLIK